MKRTLSLLFAIAFVFCAFSARATEAPNVSSTRTKVFSAYFGSKENELSPTDSGDHEILVMIPYIYTVADDESIYVVDSYNPNIDEQIKHFSKEGKYIGTIDGTKIVGRHADIVDIKYVAGSLYILSDDCSLYRYNIKDAEQTKYDAGAPEGFTPFTLIAGDNDTVVICYHDGLQYYFNPEGCSFFYRTFNPADESFSDDTVKARSFKNSAHEDMTQIKWFDFTVTLRTQYNVMAFGRDTSGTFIVRQYNDNPYTPYRYTYCFFGEDGLLSSEYTIHELWYPGGNPTRNERGNAMRLVLINDDTAYPPERFEVETEGFDGQTPSVAYSLPMQFMGFGENDDNIDETQLVSRYNVYPIYADTAPFGFEVLENGNFCITDNKQDGNVLKLYDSDGKYIETVTAKEINNDFYGITYTASIGNTVYTICSNTKTNKYFIAEYDTVTKQSASYPLPDDFNLGYYLFGTMAFKCLGKYLVFTTSNPDNPIAFEFDTEKKAFVEPEDAYNFVKDGRNVTITLDDRKYELEGYFYSTVGFTDNGDILVSGSGSTYRFSKDCRLLGIADPNPRFSSYFEYFPQRGCFANGSLYRADATKHEYIIERVDFNEDFITQNIYDANLDGKVDTQDAVWILKYAAGMYGLYPIIPGSQFYKADADKNGTINTVDAVIVLKYAAGMISEG